MPIRRPTPEERAQMVQAICDYVTTHGRQSFKAAHNRAEKDLTPPPTPYQKRRLDEEVEWVKIRRERERREESEAEVQEAARLRQALVSEVRGQVYAAARIIGWIASKPLLERWRGMIIRRRNLHKAIRADLWTRGLARDDARFYLADADSMQFALTAIISWDRARLGVVSRRLERLAGRKVRGNAHRDPRPTDEVRRLKAEGIGATEISARLGISRKSVWRILRGGPGA